MLDYFLSEFSLVLGNVVSTVVSGAANAILANVRYLDEDETSDEEPMFGTVGFYARPMSARQADSGPNRAGSAEVVGWRAGNRVRVVASRDLRLNAEVNPAEGSLGFAHYGGGFIEQSWNDDADGTTITAYAPKKTGDTVSEAHLLQMTGGGSIVLVHANGQSVTMLENGSTVITNADGTAYVEVNDDGIVINGASVSITGGAVLGASDPSSTFPLAYLPPTSLAWYAQVAAAVNTLAPGAVTATPPLPTTLVKGL